VAAFGPRAEELTFLRTRAQQPRRRAAADYSRRRGRAGGDAASPAAAEA
jgi:hypothetical protein